MVLDILLPDLIVLRVHRDEPILILLLSTMETKDPSNRFPELSTDITVEESSNAESLPLSPKTQLPAYGDERAPPKYQENGLTREEEEARKAKTRKTLFIRLLSSIFVTVIVSLVVAAAFGRIHDRQVMEKKAKEEQR